MGFFVDLKLRGLRASLALLVLGHYISKSGSRRPWAYANRRRTHGQRLLTQNKNTQFRRTLCEDTLRMERSSDKALPLQPLAAHARRRHEEMLVNRELTEPL